MRIRTDFSNMHAFMRKIKLYPLIECTGIRIPTYFIMVIVRTLMTHIQMREIPVSKLINVNAGLLNTFSLDRPVFSKPMCIVPRHRGIVV